MRSRVVIVGAGVAGASAARSLSADHEVLVLEQGEVAGAEASAQNAGMQRRLVTDPAERALACASAARLPEWIADGLPEGAFRPVGGLLATVGEGPRALALERAAADLRARGIAVLCASEAEIRRIAPALAGAATAHAWWLPEEGLLDAHAIVQTGLGVARRRGARVYLGTEVTRILVERGRAVGVVTSAGELRAEAVVLAAGAWGARLAATVGLGRVLAPLARHLFLSAPHALASREHPYCWLDDEGLYLRPEGGAWLLSACDERPVAPPAGPGSRGPVSEEQRARAMEKLARLIPAVADARLPGGWTGLRTFSPDRSPWIGQDPGLPGLWWLGALGGAGVTCAMALGDALRAAMAEAPLDGLDLDALRPARPVLRDLLPSGTMEFLSASK